MLPAIDGVDDRRGGRVGETTGGVRHKSGNRAGDGRVGDDGWIVPEALGADGGPTGNVSEVDGSEGLPVAHVLRLAVGKDESSVMLTSCSMPVLQHPPPVAAVTPVEA